MGTDKARAMAAAKQLNSVLIVGTDLAARVMGTGPTVADFIKTYKDEILPPESSQRRR
jgi:hypothetical protein